MLDVSARVAENMLRTDHRALLSLESPGPLIFWTPLLATPSREEPLKFFMEVSVIEFERWVSALGVEMFDMALVRGY